MCGIYGRLRLNQLIEGVSVEIGSVDILRHRGPDEQGTWYNQSLYWGMCRLNIIDLSGGQQPIWNEDKTACIIYNGELYNFRDLRPILEAKGHIFRTHTDTEVILHAYEEWGVDCLHHFNGMFAFAIWNENTQSLFIARDRIGEKPLYYYQDDDKLIFASEIKAILASSDVKPELNYTGMANFFAFGHAVAPKTSYRNIYKLLPGHYLWIQNGQVQVNQYWDISTASSDADWKPLSEEGYLEKIYSLLDDSVKRRMIADVPVGAFLSGGVDSSAIVALMQKHATQPVQTFSLGFEVGGAYNELSEARQVAQALGTQHHELHVQHVDLVQTLRTLVYHYDEPFGDAAGFPVYLLSQFARERVKVVLTGDGSDELFGGYRRYAFDQLAQYYQMLPQRLTQQWMPNLVDHLPRLRRAKRLLHTLPIADAARRYAAWLVLFTPDMQAELLQSTVQDAIGDHDPAWPYPLHYHGLNGGSANDHLNRLMYVDLKTWLVDMYMEKTDKATMACSLEARLPFLDHRLVELAFQIPSRYKIRGLSTKRILKKAVASLIPNSVLKRPKHGFSVPTDPWFRGELKDFTYEVLLDERTKRRGYFNSHYIEKLWREHAEGRHVWDTQLWLLLNFELWHRIYLDGEGI